MKLSTKEGSETRRKYRIIFLFLFTFVKVITKLKDFMGTESGNKDNTHCQNCILQRQNKFQNKKIS